LGLRKARTAAHPAGHETITVAYRGWGHLKKCELLKAAEGAGSEVFVSGDYGQNLTGLKLVVVPLFGSQVAGINPTGTIGRLMVWRRDRDSNPG
jgi:hypothetical protein